jgi:hypothetical protein
MAEIDCCSCSQRGHLTALLRERGEVSLEQQPRLGHSPRILLSPHRPLHPSPPQCLVVLHRSSCQPNGRTASSQTTSKRPTPWSWSSNGMAAPSFLFALVPTSMGLGEWTRSPRSATRSSRSKSCNANSLQVRRPSLTPAPPLSPLTCLSLRLQSLSRSGLFRGADVYFRRPPK